MCRPERKTDRGQQLRRLLFHLPHVVFHDASRGDSSDDECVILNVSDDDDDGFAPARAAPVLPVESVEDTANEERSCASSDVENSLGLDS